jgi:hypothetical protein
MVSFESYIVMVCCWHICSTSTAFCAELAETCSESYGANGTAMTAVVMLHAGGTEAAVHVHLYAQQPTAGHTHVFEPLCTMLALVN